MDNQFISYCHRSYRSLTTMVRHSSPLRYALLVLPSLAAVILCASDLSWAISRSASLLFASVSGMAPLTAVKTYPVFGDIYYVAMAGAYPSRSFSIITAVITLALVLLLPRVRLIPKSLTLFAAFICLITLASSLFFIFFAERFPYAVGDFSDLYIASEIGVWCAIPLIIALALLPLPGTVVEQSLVILATVAYSVIFGWLRYIMFLYVLNKFGYIFMAPMFIAFDPPLDTFYVVGIYALYVSIVSKRIKDDARVWKCT